MTGIDGKAALAELFGTSNRRMLLTGNPTNKVDVDFVRAIAAYVEGLEAKVQKTLERHSDSLGLHQATARRMEMDAKICPPDGNEIG
jgi:hypothetical protein